MTLILFLAAHYPTNHNADIFAAGSKESQFVATFRDTYLKRSPAVSDSPSMSGRDGVCLQKAAAKQIAWLQQAVGWAEGQLEISNSSAHKGEMESALVALARAVQVRILSMVSYIVVQVVPGNNCSSFS